MQQNTPTYKLARGLGWLSLGVGALELVVPGLVARTFGLRASRSLIQGSGVREVVGGLGILLLPPAPWMWSRVVGDGLDLAALFLADNRRNPRRDVARFGLAAVAGVTLLDYMCARSLSQQDAERRQLRRGHNGRAALPKPDGNMRAAARNARSN